MTEIYNYFTYGSPSLTLGGWILIAFIAFSIIAGVIKLIKAFSAPTKLTKKIAVLAAVILSIASLVAVVLVFNNDKQDYQEAYKLYSSGNYLTEEGTIENFDYEKVDGIYDEYYVSFTVNGIKFDQDSYGDYTFSTEEMETVKNSETVKIEYTNAIDDRITVLTLSVE